MKEEEKSQNPWVRLRNWNAATKQVDTVEEKVEVKSAYKEPEVVSESIAPTPVEKPHLNLYEKDTLHWAIHKEVYNRWLDSLSQEKSQHILSHPNSPEANKFNDGIAAEVEAQVQYSRNILGKK
jgi:hypothetical protein